MGIRRSPAGTGLRRGFSESQSPMGARAPFPLPDATKSWPIIAPRVLRKKNSNGVPPGRRSVPRGRISAPGLRGYK